MDETTATATVPGLYIEASDTQAVPCAGHMWAGASHVPIAGFSGTQLQELRAHPGLKVSDKELPAAQPEA